MILYVYYCIAKHAYTFRTDKRVPKTGVMLVGWGGNNGSRVTAAILANKHNISYNTTVRCKNNNMYAVLHGNHPAVYTCC